MEDHEELYIFPSPDVIPLSHPGYGEDEKEDKQSFGKFKNRSKKILGVNDNEIKNWPALKRLGVNYDDYEEANILFAEAHGGVKLPPLTKSEKSIGFNSVQIKRTKALQQLGTTEEIITDIQSRRLSSLGIKNELPTLPDIRHHHHHLRAAIY